MLWVDARDPGQSHQRGQPLSRVFFLQSTFGPGGSRLMFQGNPSGPTDEPIRIIQFWPSGGKRCRVGGAMKGFEGLTFGAGFGLKRCPWSRWRGGFRADVGYAVEARLDSAATDGKVKRS